MILSSFNFDSVFMFIMHSFLLFSFGCDLFYFVALASLIISLIALFSSIAGQSVQATAPNSNEITVTWNQPTRLYAKLNSTGGTANALTGSV